jgi:DNA-binding transcriptional ArsR family regulator
MRNVSRGLESRTKILEIMEKGKTSVRDISEKGGLSTNVVGYHLKLLQKQRVVIVKQLRREGRWTLTKYGQEKLFES